MATVDEARHPSHAVRHIVLGLIAIGLALAAAYLWFTDGADPVVQTSAAAIAPATQAPEPAAPAHVQPAVDPPVPSVRVADPPTAEPSPADAAPPPAPAAPVADLDPQVAADAAAAGMTSRVRPAQVPAQ